MQQKVPELLQHLLLRLGQLEVGGVALDGVEGAASAGHRWLVAILSRSKDEKQFDYTLDSRA